MGTSGIPPTPKAGEGPLSSFMSEVDFSTLRVLVIDDDKVTRQLIAGFLDTMGVQDIHLEADAEGGLDLLLRRHFDLVISDFEMKEMSGVDLIQRARRHPDSNNPYVPMILMTAHADRPTVLKARDAGVNAFVAKPISYKALADKIKLVLLEDRKFVRSHVYVGPDRRRRDVDSPKGERRRDEE